MGLSVRQTVCGLLAAGLAAAANFGLQPFLGTELASVVCILAAAIPAAIGFVSFHGLPFEKFALSWLRTMFMHNGWYVGAVARCFAAHAGRSLHSRWSADLLCKGNPDQHWCSLIPEGVDFLCG